MPLDWERAARHRHGVTTCWRMSPLVFVALIALRARWLAGLISSSAGRTAAPVASSTTSTTLSTALSTLRGGSGVSQFFVWFYLVLGAILGITLLSRVLSSVIDEIKLQRELYQPPRPLPADRFRPRSHRSGSSS
jgi:hypothetical protein